MGELLVEVNERIRELAESRFQSGVAWEFMCECERRGCHEPVRLSVAEYEALRAAGEWVLAPGHRLSRAERARRRARELKDNATRSRKSQRPNAASLGTDRPDSV